jgi:hypothetical protein
LQSCSIPGRGKSFSLRQNMLTVSEIRPNCYSTGMETTYLEVQ